MKAARRSKLALARHVGWVNKQFYRSPNTTHSQYFSGSGRAFAAKRFW